MPIDPLTLVETAPGDFSLLLDDLKDYSRPLRAAGRKGDGRSWQALAQHILESEMAEVADDIDFDAEDARFCAFGSDRVALERLGERLAAVVGDPELFARLVAAIPDALWEDD